SKGTLLLDEIGDMPLDLQAKLLRVLQERTYEKVGSDRKMKLEARIITTTHRDVHQMVKDGQFREDLFHRINMFPITLPPLRERMDDIPLLVDYFMDEFRKQLGKPMPGVSRTAMEILSGYHWPGNVRELKNCIERAAILNNGELIQPSHLSLNKSREGVVDDDGDDENTIRINMTFSDEEFSLEAATGRILDTILKKCGNNKARAAKVLGVDRKIFYRRK
ncbi:MAG: sigma-54-dependent Fis family transcriptional regulator, partial [Desulfobacterales bacterium]|nr:sigma-54-dependent Fis family transcriptional regulator [Desulfobacterales bacterium]